MRLILASLIVAGGIAIAGHSAAQAAPAPTATLAASVAPAAPTTPAADAGAPRTALGDDNGDGQVEPWESGYPCAMNAPGAYESFYPNDAEHTPVCFGPKVEEDSDWWNCTAMGNGICGNGAQYPGSYSPDGRWGHWTCLTATCDDTPDGVPGSWRWEAVNPVTPVVFAPVQIGADGHAPVWP